MSDPIPTAQRARPAAYYSASVGEFVATVRERIIGDLVYGSGFADVPEQKDAWREQIALLQGALADTDGRIYLEFDVPRLGSRIDAVVIAGSAVVPIEFKVGADRYTAADHAQAWDYGLDLKNFHEASHAADIWPLLVATHARRSDPDWEPPPSDRVRPPRRVNADALGDAVRSAVERSAGNALDAAAWGRAPYSPTPTIIQAARALYASHSVDAITRNDAGARNLRVTFERVEAVIADAERCRRKAIIFVTGVPGAGKTLVGLNIATAKRDPRLASHAVFLSGNGPLVEVLREALIRDEVDRERARGRRVRKGEVGQKVKPFIQNVHHFRDEGLRDETRPPADHVVIFDEAQRAWDLAKTADFMKRRKKRPGFTQSEPQFLIGYMDRRRDWAVIVCLVGGGQEIHTGEAGIGEWLDSVRHHYPHWDVHISPELGGSEYAATASITALRQRTRVALDPDLHLAVSMRSFRAERVSHFVRALLDCEADEAGSILAGVLARYPIVLTRDLDRARDWIRQRARGSERYGLLASSSAHRLKPHAVDIRVPIRPTHWFLGDPDDTRSSFYLEDAATEFQVQGLELDWTCVTWDADLRHHDGGWSHHAFRGKRWQRVRAPERQRYLQNTYRVLLTRARQGMVIFIPPGDRGDATRTPAFYDPTYRYLASLGATTI
jgi:hypothetical protein